MAAILFASQFRSLFIFPEPNSLRWFGDETWLMSEAKQQISTGVVRYPLAIGSQLERGKGLVLGMTWLSAVLYGLPLWIAGHDPIAVGRCVTATLALLLLISLYVSSRMLGSSSIASAFVVLLLVSTRSFFFASHSARPDLLAGMIVLLAIAIGVRYSERTAGLRHSNRWWFVFGAMFLFLVVSSSIHLLTLLAAAAIIFFWQISTKEHRASAAIMSAAGMLSMLCVLILAYYLANRSIALFPASAAQFHDVVHSIPILRPLSRSVQVANIVTRFKQFASEAPIIFLLPIVAPFTLKWKNARHILAFAAIAVMVSWFLFQGAEINYLIHILPLLFLCLSIVLARLELRWKSPAVPLLALAAVTFVFGMRDSSTAYKNASRLDTSNNYASRIISDSIASTWRSTSKPRVLTEPPLLDRLSNDTELEVMTDHFISFPLRVEPIDSFFAREHVNYAVLYNSPAYPKDRPRNDPFYRSVMQAGQLVTSYIGASGDIGRDYFNPSDWRDTVLLLKLGGGETR